jgi:hypothetical protein
MLIDSTKSKGKALAENFITENLPVKEGPMMVANFRLLLDSFSFN